MERDIFKERKAGEPGGSPGSRRTASATLVTRRLARLPQTTGQRGMIGRVLIFLVIMCIMAAMADLRVNPKRVPTQSVTEIEFQN